VEAEEGEEMTNEADQTKDVEDVLDVEAEVDPEHAAYLDAVQEADDIAAQAEAEGEWVPGAHAGS
jgi:hypothetical protein